MTGSTTRSKQIRHRNWSSNTFTSLGMRFAKNDDDGNDERGPKGASGSTPGAVEDAMTWGPLVRAKKVEVEDVKVNLETWGANQVRITRLVAVLLMWVRISCSKNQTRSNLFIHFNCLSTHLSFSQSQRERHEDHD